MSEKSRTDAPKPEMPREIFANLDTHGTHSSYGSWSTAPFLMSKTGGEKKGECRPRTKYTRADLSPDSELLEALEVAEKLLSEHQTYSDDDGEEYNNNRIIEAVSKIRKTIAKHTGKTG